MYSRRLLLFVATAFGFVSLGFIFRDWVFAVFVIPIAAMAMMSSLDPVPDHIPLRLQRSVNPRRTIGPEDVTVTLTITHCGRRPIRNLYVEDSGSKNVLVTEGTRGLQFTLRPNETARIAYKFRTSERGLYSLGPVYARAEDLAGLRFVEESFEDTEIVAAFPSMQYISTTEVRPRRVGPWPGLVPSRKAGVGTEFYSLRPYVPGDELRRINWKSSARLGRLITNEFEGELVTDVAIVLDTTGSAGVFGFDFIEYSISATASLASLMLRQGNRVGLLVHGKHRAWIPPGFGKRHLLRLLYQLAVVGPGRGLLPMAYVLESLAPVMLPARSQVIFISPMIEEEMAEIVGTLAASGYSVLLLTAEVDQPLTGDHAEQLARRILAVERNNILAYAGRFAQVIQVTPNTPLHTALRRTRIWRRLVIKA